MTKFKVGDRVEYNVKQGIVPHGSEGTVTSTTGDGQSITVDWDYLVGRGIHHPDFLRSVELSLEEQLEDAQKAHGVAMARRERAETLRRDTQSAIDRLKAAIAERDKPKGRVKVGHRVPLVSWIIRANGLVTEHYKRSESSSLRNQGNMFYDKESAEYERDQRTIRAKLES